MTAHFESAPLRRQIEHNMHRIDAWDKGDISILP